MTFPNLSRRPTPRTGNLRCGLRPSPEATVCEASAAWHVAWRLLPDPGFSLICDEHMAVVQAQLVYADRHPATVACDMPGTGWLLGTPSRCVPATTDDRATQHRKETDPS